MGGRAKILQYYIKSSKIKAEISLIFHSNLEKNAKIVINYYYNSLQKDFEISTSSVHLVGSTGHDGECDRTFVQIFEIFETSLWASLDNGGPRFAVKVSLFTY